MRRFTTFIALLLLTLPIPARAAVQVVTTTTGLAALAREIGGADTGVKALAGANEDPHFVDGKPSFLVALNRADLLIYVGADLEAGWLPPLLVGARNAAIQSGRPGHLNASLHVGPLLEVPSTLDRARGDVHPQGNPHFLYDPRRGLLVAGAIAEQLAVIDPEHAANYRERYRRFATNLQGRIAGWEHALASCRGKPVVGYHKSLAYLTDWLGLDPAGFIEPLPGISPSAAHLAALVALMNSKDVGTILTEPWHENKATQIVVGKTGARVVALPGDAAGEETYIDFVGQVVSDLRDVCTHPGGGQ